MEEEDQEGSGMVLMAFEFLVSIVPETQVLWANKVPFLP